MGIMGYSDGLLMTFSWWSLSDQADYIIRWKKIIYIYISPNDGEATLASDLLGHNHEFVQIISGNNNVIAIGHLNNLSDQFEILVYNLWLAQPRSCLTPKIILKNQKLVIITKLIIVFGHYYFRFLFIYLIWMAIHMLRSFCGRKSWGCTQWIGGAVVEGI